MLHDQLLLQVHDWQWQPLYSASMMNWHFLILPWLGWTWMKLFQKAAPRNPEFTMLRRGEFEVGSRGPWQACAHVTSVWCTSPWPEARRLQWRLQRGFKSTHNHQKFSILKTAKLKPLQSDGCIPRRVPAKPDGPNLFQLRTEAGCSWFSMNPGRQQACLFDSFRGLHFDLHGAIHHLQLKSILYNIYSSWRTAIGFMPLLEPFWASKCKGLLHICAYCILMHLVDFKEDPENWFKRALAV